MNFLLRKIDLDMVYVLCILGLIYGAGHFKLTFTTIYECIGLVLIGAVLLLLLPLLRVFNEYQRITKLRLIILHLLQEAIQSGCKLDTSKSNLGNHYMLKDKQEHAVCSIIVPTYVDTELTTIYCYHDADTSVTEHLRYVIRLLKKMIEDSKNESVGSGIIIKST